MSEIKVLHLFDFYIPNSQNWIPNLLIHCNDVEHHIGAYRLLKNEHLLPQFKYVNDNRLISLLNSRLLKKSTLYSRLYYYLVQKNEETFKSSIKSIEHYCKKENINVIHSHFAKAGCEYLDIKRKTQLPYLVSFYGWDYEKLPKVRPQFISFYKDLFKESSLILCEGPYAAGKLNNMGCPKEKIRIIPLGVDFKKFDFHKRVKYKSQLNLLQIASFTEKKGHEITIRAFSKAHKSCPNLKLTMIGNDRGNKKEIVSLIEKLNLNEYVTIMDAVPHSELSKLMKDYDVFIHPSRYSKDLDCEGGAPVVILEASATGMPIISTKHCDIPLEVIEGKTGFLAEEGDHGKISSFIQYFYEMEDSRFKEFSINAREHVKENFNLVNLGENLSEVYFKMIGTKY